jgi:hypothetical protein
LETKTTTTPTTVVLEALAIHDVPLLATGVPAAKNGIYAIHRPVAKGMSDPRRIL